MASTAPTPSQPPVIEMLENLHPSAVLQLPKVQATIEELKAIVEDANYPSEVRRTASLWVGGLVILQWHRQQYRDAVRKMIAAVTSEDDPRMSLIDCDMDALQDIAQDEPQIEHLDQEGLKSITAICDDLFPSRKGLDGVRYDFLKGVRIWLASFRNPLWWDPELP